jgi:hypothetical protein
VVVGADGTPPARAAGRVLPRLLRTVIVTAGLAALGWLLSTLLATGGAAAESTPDTGSPGLLGGLVGGLTHLLGATPDTAPANPPGDTAPAPVDPIVAAPPPPAAPTPAPAMVAHVRPRSATATRPSPTARPGRTAAVAHRSTRAPAAAGQAAPTTASSSAVPATGHTGRKPAPDRAPSAPAAPNSSMSAGHDGPGQARGGTALPAGQTVAVPPAGRRTDLGRASLAGSRTAGLPARSPD